MSYATADEAAIAAIELINPISIAQNVEYAGRIYSRSSRYFFTRAQTLNNRYDSDPGPAVAGAENIGTYHTHAGDFLSTDEIFSPQDKLKATMANEISYIGTPCQRILKYTPYSQVPNGEVVAPVGIVTVLRNIYVLRETEIVGSPNSGI
jgi:hypothetical protein